MAGGRWPGPRPPPRAAASPCRAPGGPGASRGRGRGLDWVGLGRVGWGRGGPAPPSAPPAPPGGYWEWLGRRGEVARPPSRRRAGAGLLRQGRDLRQPPRPPGPARGRAPAAPTPPPGGAPGRRVRRPARTAPAAVRRRRRGAGRMRRAGGRPHSGRPHSPPRGRWRVERAAARRALAVGAPPSVRSVLCLEQPPKKKSWGDLLGPRHARESLRGAHLSTPRTLAPWSPGWGARLGRHGGWREGGAALEHRRGKRRKGRRRRRAHPHPPGRAGGARAERLE